MNTQIALDKCAPIISSQLSPVLPALPSPQNPPPKLAITLSRQSGCGAHEIAKLLARYFERHGPDKTRPWHVLDRNLAEKVLEDHKLPIRYARFMPEDRPSELGDVMEELLGAHPPSSTFVQQTSETIYHLAQQGNVILIGRGANLITGNLPHAFHVRLVASLESRLEHFQKSHDLTREMALKQIQHEDRGRKRYLKKYFGQNLENPLLYHLVLNTDLMSFDKAARVIGETALAGFQVKSLPNRSMDLLSNWAVNSISI
jgi:cytidylate kinase